MSWALGGEPRSASVPPGAQGPGLGKLSEPGGPELDQGLHPHESHGDHQLASPKSRFLAQPYGLQETGMPWGSREGKGEEGRAGWTPKAKGQVSGPCQPRGLVLAPERPDTMELAGRGSAQDSGRARGSPESLRCPRLRVARGRSWRRGPGEQELRNAKPVSTAADPTHIRKPEAWPLSPTPRGSHAAGLSVLELRL